MSASASPDMNTAEREVAQLTDVQGLFRQMRDLARQAQGCSVPAIRRDSEQILATVEQALELLDLGRDNIDRGEDASS